MNTNPVYIGTAQNDNFRFYLANTTQIASLIKQQGLISPLSHIALVDSIGICGIMGLMEKSSCKIMTTINGDGPCGKVIVMANNLGQVKGLIQNRYVEDQTSDNGINLANGIGQIGNIEIMKDYGLKSPYYSETSIIKGDVLLDFSYYFSYSQQTPTAISGGIHYDDNLDVAGSAILLIQVMPNTDDLSISKLEEKLLEHKNISQLINQKTPQEIMALFFEDFKILDTKELQYHCDCSMQKCITNINLLSDEDKLELINDQKPIEMNCDWCQKKYIIDKDKIKLKNNTK